MLLSSEYGTQKPTQVMFAENHKLWYEKCKKGVSTLALPASRKRKPLQLLETLFNIAIIIRLLFWISWGQRWKHLLNVDQARFVGKVLDQVVW